MIVTSADHRWYAIQTTSGHENKVRLLLQRRIDADPRPAEERAIRQALVPTQEAVEIKNGKKVNVERKIYPGYVLVEMVMDQETAHAVNGIQGVIKFVGHERLPQPLRPEEVNRLLGVADDSVPVEVKEEIPFLVGQAVAITEGPFTDFNGTVEEVLPDKGKGARSHRLRHRRVPRRSRPAIRARRQSESTRLHRRRRSAASPRDARAIRAPDRRGAPDGPPTPRWSRAGPSGPPPTPPPHRPTMTPAARPRVRRPGR